MLLFSFAPTWFTQGVLHPLQTPAHIILILAIGLLIGQQQMYGKSFLGFSVAAVAGFFLNQNLSLNWNFELILLALALSIGLLVVVKLKLGIIITLLLATMSGLAIGYSSTPIMIPGLGINSVYSWLAGAAITIIISAVIVAALARLVRRYWDGIILRIIGSWIATSAIFVLTLMLAKH